MLIIPSSLLALLMSAPTCPAALEARAVSPPAQAGPIIQVQLNQPVYHISIDPSTGAPRMPTRIVASARVVGAPPGEGQPQDFLWRVLLRWSCPGCQTRHDIEARTFAHPSPFPVDLSGEVRGGKLTVYAKTVIGNRVIFGACTALVVGDNPSRAQVLRAFPRSRFGLIASKIGMAESGLRQFTPPTLLDPGGMPVVSYTDDVGLMQLNAPSGSISSADQVWDWRANLRQGMEILAGKRQVTVLASRAAVAGLRQPPAGMARLAYLNVLRQLVGLHALDMPHVQGLSNAPGSGMDPGDPDADHLMLSQVEREEIRRYNGGSEYDYALRLDPRMLIVDSGRWVVDPTRGGLDEHTGDIEYVQHVLQARSGLSLEAPKPAPATRHVGRRHSRRRRRGRHS